MPKDNIVARDLTTNCLSSENYTKARHNGYYLGRTKEQQKKDSIENEKINSDIDTSKSLYFAMKTQRRYSPSKTMRNCGLTIACDQATGELTPIHKKVMGMKNKSVGSSGVLCSVSKEGVTVKGVGFCKSPFCVTCMGYTRTQRMERITKGLRQARIEGLHAYFVTLTIQRTADIKQQVKDLLYGWKCLLDKMSYRTKKQGIKTYIVRNLDITFRPKHREIYHTHLHCIVIFDKDIQPFTDKKTKVKISDIPTFLEHAWVDIQTSKDVKASLQGQHIERIRHDEKLSRYVSKFEGLSKELANFTHKTGKKTQLDFKSIGFMELLGHVKNEDETCIKIYRQFLRAMKNARTVSFSRSWKVLEERHIQEEESEEESEDTTEEIFISVNWFLKIGRDFDKFVLCLHIAYLTHHLEKVFYILDGEPSKNSLYHLFDHFNVLNL